MPQRQKGYFPMERLSLDERLKLEGRWQEHWYKHIAPYTIGRTVLDVGAGTGYGLEILKAHAARADGFDVASLNPNIPVSSIENFKDESYDLVICIDVIEHVADDISFFKHLLRVAKDRIFLSTPNWNKTKAANEFHAREYTPAELRQLIGELKHDVWVSDDNCKIMKRDSISDSEAENNFGVLIKKGGGMYWKQPRLTEGGIEPKQLAHRTKTRTITQVVVTSDPLWAKWPHTDDTDFTEVFDKKWESHYTHEDTEIIVKNRLLPISLAYRSVGYAPRPPAHPGINNTLPHPPKVIEEQKLLLRYFEGAEVILWDHAHQCAPEVAAILPELFPLRILPFGDDCPGSSDIKTFPVCRFFNALYHSMFVWSFEKGEDVGQMYRDRGVAKTYFKASTESAGLFPKMKEMGYSTPEKIANIQTGKLPPIDFGFVGYFRANQWRLAMMNQAADTVPAGLTARFYGVGCPHGILEPRVPPEGCGYTLPPVYKDTLFSVNPQVSSLFNTRLMDLWLCGVAQLIYDPHKELQRNGFEPDKDYIAFNGSSADLWAKVQAWRSKPQELANLIEHAYKHCVKYMEEYSVSKTYARIYAEGLGL